MEDVTPPVEGKETEVRSVLELICLTIIQKKKKAPAAHRLLFGSREELLGAITKAPISSHIFFIFVLMIYQRIGFDNQAILMVQYHGLISSSSSFPLLFSPPHISAQTYFFISYLFSANIHRFRVGINTVKTGQVISLQSRLSDFYLNV